MRETNPKIKGIESYISVHPSVLLYTRQLTSDTMSCSFRTPPSVHGKHSHTCHISMRLSSFSLEKNDKNINVNPVKAAPVNKNLIRLS